MNILDKTTRDLEDYIKTYKESLNKALSTLDELEEAISVTRCSAELNNKEVMSFELWVVDKGYTRINELYFIKETAITSESILLRRYNKDLKQSL